VHDERSFPFGSFRATAEAYPTITSRDFIRAVVERMHAREVIFRDMQSLRLDVRHLRFTIHANGIVHNVAN